MSVCRLFRTKGLGIIMLHFIILQSVLLLLAVHAHEEFFVCCVSRTTLNQTASTNVRNNSRRHWLRHGRFFTKSIDIFRLLLSGRRGAITVHNIGVALLRIELALTFKCIKGLHFPVILSRGLLTFVFIVLPRRCFSWHFIDFGGVHQLRLRHFRVSGCQVSISYIRNIIYGLLEGILREWTLPFICIFCHTCFAILTRNM